MTRSLLVAAVAMSLIGMTATADAGKRHKHRTYHPHSHGMWQAPVAIRRPGPPWAMPNECYTDEGYGRFSPCDLKR